MQKGLTPVQRVERALRRQEVDKIPFTTYEIFLPQCALERELRNRGLCIVLRKNSYRIEYRDVIKKTFGFTDEKGRNLVKTVFSTPLGDLDMLEEVMPNTRWTHEHLFKGPDDYRKIEYLIKSAVVFEDYDSSQRLIEQCGDDVLVRDNLPLEPLQQLISSYFMDVETFSYEWCDNRDEIMRLYEAFVEQNRKVYNVVANGPMKLANYGGNVIPQVIGRQTFERLYMPHYSEAAEALHKKGKLIGCHFDGDNAPIMDLIAQADLDYIEAYDPGISPPIDAARAAFAEKVLWINWPSAWHLDEYDDIVKKTRGLIDDAQNQEGLLFGITEDIPPDCWQRVMLGILDAIDIKAK